MRAKYLRDKEPRQPKQIRSLLGTIIEKASVGVDIRHGDIVNDWESIAPPDWVTYGTPVGVKDRTLLVEVPDGTAATVLKYQIEDLKTAIGEHFEDGLVAHVRIKIVR